MCIIYTYAKQQPKYSKVGAFVCVYEIIHV